MTHSIILHLITSERTSGSLINLSGRQRMLTQNAALLSNKLVTTADSDQRSDIRSQLNLIADTLEKNHQLLLYGDSEQKLPPSPNSVRAIFFDQPGQLDNKLRNFIGAIRELAAESEANLVISHPLLQYIEAAALGELFTLNNQVVTEYQTLSESKIDFVHLSETVVLLVILAALLLEGLYVFRPMVQTIENDRRKLEALNEELAALSSIDGLTAIANRRHFDTILQQEWGRHSREQSSLALTMIDIDFFKRFNDTYGHQAGDECLIQVARFIKTALKRPIDLAARYGGEEFAIILPNTDLLGAAQVAERIRATVEQAQIEHQSSPINQVVTISVGVAAITPTNTGLPADLIKAADRALYAAKSGGRNQVALAELI